MEILIRNCRRLLQLQKIINNKTPTYLQEKLPPNRRLFLPNIFREIRCRTTKYSNSFFPNSIKSWNIFLTNFENFPSFTEFKRFLLTLFRPTFKSVFGIHDPSGIRLLFQTRLGLSPLRSHKKSIILQILLLMFVCVRAVLKIIITSFYRIYYY